MIPSYILSYQQIVHFAQQLSLEERVQLVRDILAAPLNEPSQQQAQQSTHFPLETLYGFLAGQGPVPSEEDIRNVRREVWGKFYQ